MIEHIRYEVVKLLEFMTVGNGWCGVLNPDLARFSSLSILEAGLIHARCVIEFLGNKPERDRMVARDYLPDWSWTISDQLQQRVGELHGRLAHLGTVRASVALQGDFSWANWLEGNVPAVLRGVRDFLAQLLELSPQRYQLFVQPRDDLPEIDLLPMLCSLLEHRPSQ